VRAWIAAGRREKRGDISKTCPECSKIFESTVPKQFCSIKCRSASPLFRAACVQAHKHLQRRKSVVCLECGKAFERIVSDRARKFCCREHYRKYFWDRFDRWIASPRTIASLQNYDEFMLLPQLPCLVEGCGWAGEDFGKHLNCAHGITAREFKRAAGFNLTTGLVVAALRKAMSDRSKALGLGAGFGGDLGHTEPPPDYRSYFSREGREHYLKAMTLRGRQAPE
jgi:predicted transcriptional regulator